MPSLYELRNNAVQEQYDLQLQIKDLDAQIAQELKESEGELTEGIQALVEEKDGYISRYNQIEEDLRKNLAETIEYRCKVVRNEEAFEASLEDEIKFLQAKLKACRNKMDWQETKIREDMASLGTRKDTFGVFKCSVSSRESIEMDEDVALAPAEQLIESGASMQEVMDTFPFVSYSLKASKTEAKKMTDLPNGFTSVSKDHLRIA